MMHAVPNNRLRERLRTKEATIGLVGAGYAALPLGLEFARRGLRLRVYDIDARKVEMLRKGRSYIDGVPDADIAQAVAAGTLDALTDPSILSGCDAIIVCVPTPLDANRGPDMSYVVSAMQTVAKHLQRGQLVSLESTTYPGTTTQLVQPILEATGLKTGQDFHLVFSPERVDPGNARFNVENTPKVVGGVTPGCLDAGVALYGSVVKQVVPVSSPSVAEAAKLLENIYRCVNIALVNELKIVLDAMGVDVWEVVDAAKTKPFGFQAFYPGPGLGGHCIPIDPFYLSWKAREYDLNTRFIELAGEVNAGMPRWVVARVAHALNTHGRPLRGSTVLVLGVAYKRDVDDVREAPAVKLIELLEREGCTIRYHDPHVPQLRLGAHGTGRALESIQLTEDEVGRADCVLVVTDHSAVDYSLVERHARIIVDTRNVYRERDDKKIFGA